MSGNGRVYCLYQRTNVIHLHGGWYVNLPIRSGSAPMTDIKQPLSKPSGRTVTLL